MTLAQHVIHWWTRLGRAGVLVSLSSHIPDISILTGSKCLSIAAYVFPPFGSIAVSIEFKKK